ncbi:MAG: aminoglycoside phosphotransferase family protein [Euryarchaeota archaeon]|nr:aminoglycoside phosphotransferase family protein [Euryarchaeota archaeon]MDE1837763.1 aminoglycoside phosphotransferase family protein [Euryarchaeota archaeon]MDE2045415.1 aminoglycoside phosphotransferase family protein [Thermoplasmata archaeon]
MSVPVAPELRAKYSRIVREALPGYSPRRIALNAQGALNIVFDVDGRFIFRFPRAERGAKLLAMECRLLPRLARHLPLAIPEPFVVGSLPGRHEWPFMGYERIPGRQLQWARLSEPRFRALVRGLAPTFQRLATFPVREATRLGVPGGDPPTFRQEMTDLYESLKKHGYPAIPDELRSQLDGRFRAYLDAPDNFRFRPTLLHGEVHSSHVLWKTERVSGLIDWGFASIGDPARDFAPWVAHFGTRGIPQLMEGRTGPHDRTFLERLEFYRLLIPIWQIRNRAWEGNLKGAKEAVGWLRRALKLPATEGWSR